MEESGSGTKPALVILGATGGVGYALCRRLAATGASLMIAGRDEVKLAHLAGEINGTYCVLDARRFDEVEKCFAQATAKFGRIDGAVNCVGSLLLKPAHQTSEDDFHSVLSTNLGSAFACVRAAAKFMRKDGGSIVLISSAAAKIGLTNHEAISAAKAGIDGLMLAAAATYSRQKIRVNCVAPGLVQTDLTRRITDSESSRQSSLAMHPLGRLGDPDDIASAIAWLLSSESSWVTGQFLAVDGGLSRLKMPQAMRLGE